MLKKYIDTVIGKVSKKTLKENPSLVIKAFDQEISKIEEKKRTLDEMKYGTLVKVIKKLSEMEEVFKRNRSLYPYKLHKTNEEVENLGKSIGNIINQYYDFLLYENYSLMQYTDLTSSLEIKEKNMRNEQIVKLHNLQKDKAKIQRMTDYINNS